MGKKINAYMQTERMNVYMYICRQNDKAISQNVNNW